MNLLDVKNQIDKIKKESGDDEVAHILEDELYSDFIEYVACGGKKNLQIIAREILKTKNLEFARWCA